MNVNEMTTTEICNRLFSEKLIHNEVRRKLEKYNDAVISEFLIAKDKYKKACREIKAKYHEEQDRYNAIIMPLQIELQNRKAVRETKQINNGINEED